MTYLIPEMVIEVSAMFVARTIFRHLVGTTDLLCWLHAIHAKCNAGDQLQQLGAEPWRSLLKHKLLGQVKTGPARTTSSQHIFAFSCFLCLPADRTARRSILVLPRGFAPGTWLIIIRWATTIIELINSFLLGRVTCSKVGHVFIPKEKLPGERGALGLCQAHL